MKNNTNIESRGDIKEVEYEKVSVLVEKMRAKYPREVNIDGLEPALTTDIYDIVTTTRLSDIDALRGEILQERTMLDNAEVSYSSDIDITELPEGLTAEMTGFRKGWKAFADSVLTLLDQYKDKIK